MNTKASELASVLERDSYDRSLAEEIKSRLTQIEEEISKKGSFVLTHRGKTFRVTTTQGKEPQK